MIVLLTGGNGFVGMNITEKLINEYIDVVVYDINSFPKEMENAFDKRKGKYTWVYGDILDSAFLEEVIEKYAITDMIHAAAITSDSQREMKSGKTIVDVNISGTVNALEAARKYNLGKVIHLSSVAAYGSTAYEGSILVEDSSISQPNSLYEISKFSAERIALRYKQLFGMEIVAVRIGEVFGTWERDTGFRDTLSAPFQATQIAIEEGKALLPRAGRKNWVYGKDIAEAIYSLLKVRMFNHDVYHLGSTFVWSLVEWCELLSYRYPKFEYEVLQLQDRREANIDFHHSVDQSPLQINRLMEDIGFYPTYDLKKSFDDYMKWIDNFAIQTRR